MEVNHVCPQPGADRSTSTRDNAGARNKVHTALCAKVAGKLIAENLSNSTITPQTMAPR